MNSPRVYIIILNWNGWEDSIECLESVMRQDYPNYQIVLCDNASTDQSLLHISEWAEGKQILRDGIPEAMKRFSSPSIAKPVAYTEYDRITAEKAGTRAQTDLVLVQTGANLGFAGGNNVGLRYAKNQADCDYVWLLNNDTVIETDTLSQMVRHSSELFKAGKPNTCGSLICFYDDPTIVQALGGSQFDQRTGIASKTLGRFRKRYDVIDHQAAELALDYITGCSWLLPGDYLTDVGLMEEEYFLYYEEIDWVMRAGDRYQLTYAADALVYHKEGSSIGSKSLTRGPSRLAEFYMARSRLKYMQRFNPRRTLMVYLTMLLQAFNRLRQGRPKNSLVLLQVILGKQTFK